MLKLIGTFLALTASKESDGKEGNLYLMANAVIASKGEKNYQQGLFVAFLIPVVK